MSKKAKSAVRSFVGIGAILLPVAALGAVVVWFISRASDYDAPLPLSSVPRSHEYAGSSPESKRGKRPEPPEGATVVGSSPDGVVLFPGALDLESRLHQAGSAAGEDVETLIELLKLYSTGNQGSLPIAPSNDILIGQLMGDNPNRVAVLSREARNVSDRGELMDRWGVPYFFHPISSKLMEVRSAGPDRTMWTEDDVQLPVPDDDLKSSEWR